MFELEKPIGLSPKAKPLIYLDEDIANHPKILKIGSRFGKTGPARVLALYVQCIGYARKFGTRGIVPREFFKNALDPSALSIANAMAKPGSRLLHKHRIGYLIHDYDDWNEHDKKIKERRDKDRIRKSLWRQRIRESRNGNRADLSPGRPVDVARDVYGHKSLVRTDRTCTQYQPAISEGCTATLTRCLSPATTKTKNPTAWTKAIALAHVVMETFPDRHDWIPEFKLRAAVQGLPYAELGGRDRRPLHARAIDYVEGVRQRRSA